MKQAPISVTGRNAVSTRLLLRRRGRARTALWALAILVALTIAAYVGFRLPNLWSVTLYNVTLGDGTIRRSLFGTLTAPLWEVFEHSYAGYAAIATLISMLLAVVALLAAIGARTSSQRVLVMIWVLAPTGGYLFHENGYLDQVNYLLFFLTLFLWTRFNPYIAVLPMVAAVLIHESALLTVWPLLLAIGALTKLTREKLLALAVPLAAGGALMLVPPMDPSTSDALLQRLQATLPFGFRPDALELFSRTQSESWNLYSISEGIRFVLPLGICLLLFWIFAAITSRTSTRTDSLQMSLLLLASISPLLLIFGGWDFSRWMFLALTNFTIALYLWLQSRDNEPSITLVSVATIPFLSLAFHPLVYFDDLSPRSLDARAVILEIREPDFFTLPKK